MTKYGYTDSKPQVLKRLSRAEGQVRGISRMVAEDKYCIDILTQISAAQAALDKVALELVREHTKHCMMHGIANTVLDDQITGDALRQTAYDKADELVGALSRMMSR